MATPRRVTETDAYIMRSKGAVHKTRTAQGMEDETSNIDQVRRVGGTIVTVQEPDVRRLYKRGNWGWYPVDIPGNNVATVLGPDGMGNYALQCPECDGFCGEDGKPCPTRGEAPYRVCPVCQKRITDTPPEEAPVRESSAAEIKDISFKQSTPELRTQAKLDAHMYYYHPSEMSILAPQSARNPVQSPPPGRMSETS